MQKTAPIRDLPLPPQRASITQLDTVRTVAVLGVFLHHLWKTVILNPEGVLQSALDPFFSAMAGSVILFNIISGFLLALPHLGPDRRPFPGYRYFIQRRFFRIIPPYYLALILFTFANILKFGLPLAPAFHMLLEHLLFVNSLDYSYMLSNFSHFWYLGQLAQFYLFFPLILGLFMRIGPAKAALSIISICWGVWIVVAWFIPEVPKAYPGTFENLMHFNLPGHLPEFATGMWLASLWNSSASTVRRRIFTRPFSFYVAALALVLVVGTPFLPSMALPYIHIYYVAASILLFLLLLTWPPVAEAGKAGIVRNFAALSYVIYIVHYPLFSYVGVMPSNVTHTIPNFLLLTALLLPLCYLTAMVFSYLSDFIVTRFSRVEAPRA